LFVSSFTVTSHKYGFIYHKYIRNGVERNKKPPPFG
jgi:hypothetical protein